MKRIVLFACSVMTAVCANAGRVRYPSAEGLVMTGYQGWFNAENDGAGLGWKHYEKDREFYPGRCTIDLWPDVSEYEVTYDSPFRMADGSVARLFSSADRSTVFLHFGWMREYGIDGAFVQRFVSTIRSVSRKDNATGILLNAVAAAEKYDRAVCVMYDLSGMKAEEVKTVTEDWKELVSEYRITDSGNYLHHNGKPLVAIWGIGFNDNRKYGLDEARKLVSFFKKQGCSILLGVPAHWRSLDMDTVGDAGLHEVIKASDIVHPWFVGRYNYDSYPRFNAAIREDMNWCRENGLDYMPVVFPGFSWYNLKSGVAAPLNQIPRLGGRFLWRQIHGAIKEGATMIYVAMFDEIDEGTAIFKCANEVPVGASPFLTYEGVAADHYLWLAGMGAKALRREIPCTETMPERQQL